MKGQAFVTALCIALAQIGEAEPRSLTAVADEWPPFSGSALPNNGKSLDIIQAVLQRAGYAVETQVVPWARIMEGAQIGQYDVIGSLFFDAALTDHLVYSDPYLFTDVQLVRRRGDTHRFTSVAALRGLSIAVGDGFLYEEEFDKATYLDKVVVTTTLQGLRMVAFGRVELTLDSVDVVNHALRVEDPALAERIEIAPGVLATQGIHMAVRSDLPDSAQIVADFNAALAEMTQDGSLDRLIRLHVLE